MNFTERAREEAVNQHGNTTHASAFADGAEWGYRQAVEEAFRRKLICETDAKVLIEDAQN